MVPGFGVTTIEASGPAVTMAVAVPESVPWAARTVLANVAATEPAVNGAVSPVVPAGMVPPPFTTDQVTLAGVRATVLPRASLPDAVYVSEVLMGMVPGFGVTTIDASAPAITVTVAVAVMPLQLTVIVDVPGVEPAVNSPVLVIVPPPDTAQMPATLRTLPLLFLITAVNCCVPPTGMVAVVGEMVTVEAVCGPLESLHAAVNDPANASANRAAALRARGFNVRRVSLMTVFIELLLT
jgi:hypothetical protein